MPAFAQRLLPLMCHGSRDVILSSAGCAFCTNRRGHPALNQRMDSRSRMGREWNRARRRCSLPGDDWQCTGTCTVSGRNLVDEWKSVDWNQR